MNPDNRQDSRAEKDNVEGEAAAARPALHQWGEWQEQGGQGARHVEGVPDGVVRERVKEGRGGGVEQDEGEAGRGKDGSNRRMRKRDEW